MGRPERPNSISIRFRGGLDRQGVRRRTAANTPWTSEGRVSANRRPEPSQTDLPERHFPRSEHVFQLAEDAGFEPARACTQPAFQIRKPRYGLVPTSPFTLTKRPVGG